MVSQERSAYLELREPIKLSKTSHQEDDEGAVPIGMQPAYLARKLIRLAVGLTYMDSLGSKEINDLDLKASPVETARSYVEAAKQLTSQDHLLQSKFGLESLMMMMGYYYVHLGSLQDAHLLFQRALHLALRIGLPDTAKADGPKGRDIWRALQRLISVDRGLSVLGGVSCVNTEIVEEPARSIQNPCEYLDDLHARLWLRVIGHNTRIRSRWYRDEDRQSILGAEYAETLSIDTVLKQATQSVPSSWWALPYSGTQNGSRSFDELDTSKEHFFSIVVTHLPYVLLPNGRYTPEEMHNANQLNKYAYSRAAAVSASREVLARFPHYQAYQFVPASYRALEQKAFIAAVVLLLAHMAGHWQVEMTSIEHERPKDLNLVRENIACMDAIFELDKNAPGSERASLLRRLMEIETNMMSGVRYGVTNPPDQAPKTDDAGHVLSIPIPYFGSVVFSLRQEEPAQQLLPYRNGYARAFDVEPIDPGIQHLPLDLLPYTLSGQEIPPATSATHNQNSITDIDGDLIGVLHQSGLSLGPGAFPSNSFQQSTNP